MTFHPLSVPAAPINFAAIRAELGISDSYPAEAQAEAEQAAAAATWRDDPDRADDRQIDFVTVDPAESLDLDQAVHIEGRDGGFRVRYAIADIGSFLTPGGALDEESHRRALTLYSPDTRTPLYPAVLSEGAASLLPDADRPALMWTIDLDDTGEPVEVALSRTTVRSRDKLSYDGVQTDADRGELHPSIALLPHVGALRLQAARRRHAIDLDMPAAEVEPTADGHWTLTRRAMLPVERFNAQISLLTGICAAQIMIDGKAGILRTLPTPTSAQVAALKRATATFGVPWPDGVPPGDVVSDLDSSRPRQAAFLEDALSLLRGAGYTPFDGSVPADVRHAGIGAHYAHVTAPLRRLVDRYGQEICLALLAGSRPDDSLVSGLADLPARMRTASALAGQLNRACTDAVSEFLLADRVGQVLTGIVVQVDRDRDRATILLDEPPIRVRATADGFTEGSRVAVRLRSVGDRPEVTLVR